MKKRLLSLVLCLVMVFSLFPMVGAPARAEGDPTFDYAPATDPTSGNSAWTVTDITNYESNGTLVDQYSLGNDLYYKDGDNYYPVAIVSDPEYFYKAYSGPEALKIYDTFRFDSGTWGKKTSTEYFAFYNGDMHCVYANNRSSAGRYDVTLFIYKGSRYGNTVTNESSWTNAYSRTVLMLSGNSTTPSVTQGEWFYTYQWWGATVGTSHNYYYGNDTGTPPQLYLRGEDGSKKAIIFTDNTGAQRGYLMNSVNLPNSNSKETRNWKMETTTAASPQSPTFDGTLYYKRDLTQVPVVDPDPTETTTPGGEGGGDSIINPGGVNDAGFKLQKSLEMNTSGSYDIHMESYSTANTVKYGIVEKVPTDFIVVVDQSGSMDTEDMATDYAPVSGTKTLEECATGSYYYKDGDNYYRVYGTKDYLMEYHPTETKWTQNIINDAGYDLSWFQGEDEATFSQSNQYYYKTSDGVYRPVHVTATGKVGTYYIKFYYKDANGQDVHFIRPDKPIYKNVFGGGDSKYGPTSLGYAAVNPLVLAAYPDTEAYTYSEFIGVTTGMYVNYPMYTRHVGYNQLCYRDVNGVEHVLGPTAGDSVATYCNSAGQAVISAGSSTRMNYSGLYQATGTETRIAALKGALTEFVKAVAAESDTKDGLDTTCPVDNRIAIVGFSSLNESGWYGTKYNNTEILTGENLTVSGNNGVYFEDATNSDYATALVSATDGQIGADHVNPKLTQAIAAITANGGTQPEYGFQMAKSIMDKRTLTQYTLQTGDHSTKNRNVIVVFFTDGQPGDYYISNQYSEANDVVASALPLKTAGAKVFSIGVFGESDGNPLTYYDRTASSESDTKDWKFLGGWMETYRESGTYYCMRRQWRPAGAEGNLGYTPTANDTIFDYMSVTSSNYPGAQNFIAPGWLSGNYSGTYTEATDGVRHKETSEDTNKFYRMAATQDTLVEAFKQSVSYASTQQQHADVVNLNTTSIFRDEVNTADFDVSHATYSVTWQPIHVDPSLVTPDHPSAIGELENDPDFPVVTPVVNQPVPANGVIEYSGFDYGANFVSMAKLKGYKLVVEVNGIVPTTYNQPIKSNADPEGEDYFACGIYEAGKDEPAYSVKSPTLLVEMHEPATTDVVMNKTLSDPSPVDGSYTITLDAYAKGNSNQQTTTETTGSDVVIVVDKSGSMDNTMGNGTRYSKAVDAINAFIGQADDSEADHRIAIIRGGKESGDSQVIAYNGGTAVNYADLQANADSVFKSVKTESGDLNAALTAMGNDGTNSMFVSPTFDAVSKLLNGRADQSRKAIVIFLSDGKCNGTNADSFNNNVLPVKAAADVFAIRIDTGTNTGPETFMQAVSSEYPNATWTGSGYATPGAQASGTDYYQFINPSTTTSFSGVFDEVMEIIDLNVNLDKDAYLLDIINLENLALRSDLSEPIVTVKTQKGTIDRNGNITWDENTEDITDRVTVTYDGSTGAVKVTGFDYSANYIGYPKPVNVQEGTGRNQGKKLIVEIAGLVPVHPGENQTSNTRAGVYDKEDDPAKEVPSPTFSITSDTNKTFVIDFSAPMIVATDAKSVAKMSGKNGDFTLIGTDVVYQITKSVGGGNLALEGVDQAFAFGKPVGMTLDNAVWSTITTIPAGSVYFDDDFVSETATAVTVGDGSGYNAGVVATPADENEAAGTYTFTFYGTGIDVYCTTAPDGGMIQAKIDGGITNGQADLNKVQSVRNYDKEVTRYNVPTISFRNLGQGEHTLELRVMSSSNYKLDGIRVYNPVANSTYEGQGTHEQYATFINMRDVMVNNAQTTVFTDEAMTDVVLGALFVDDTSKLTRLRGATDEEITAGTGIVYVDAEGNEVSADTPGAKAMINAYANQFEAYKKNSPKHEIYLDKNEAITFVLTADAAAAAASGNLWIGLSAPDADKQSGIVEFKAGKTQQISTAVDEYYPITPDRIGANNTVTITNTDDNMISVTNLKITGNQDIYNAANTPKAGTESVSEDAVVLSVEDVVPMVFEPVTMQTVKIAANDGVDPDAPAPDPTPTPTPGISELVRQLISNFVSYLFQSVARLFHP